ncbi:hypothetical protein STRTUCAR8_01812 [Streptomyces turgidiscabies Car8]|uniref:Uncharacterized protein n=1 Tax=Streptomyces turgidiscabies (strain Car8) TaxID=698760 RepID=L7F361_STRT8|nr:hypothetical protein STRTUCAR8_01812 [Streptomyces turgidiscabies Car8]
MHLQELLVAGDGREHRVEGPRELAAAGRVVHLDGEVRPFLEPGCGLLVDVDRVLALEDDRYQVFWSSLTCSVSVNRSTSVVVRAEARAVMASSPSWGEMRSPRTAARQGATRS